MIIQGTKVQKFIGYFNRNPRNFYQYLPAAKKGSPHSRTPRKTDTPPLQPLPGQDPKIGTHLVRIGQ